MSKMDTHATAPPYERERRNRHAIIRRAEKALERPQKVVRAATALRYCPACGAGLTTRYRAPGAMHRRRGCTCVCRWTP
jgi:hypothetical protein